VLTTAVFGFDSWVAFGHHIAVHRLAPLANHAGLRSIVAQSWEGRWTAVMQPGALDPYAIWNGMRRETFAARHGLYLVLAGGLTIVATLAAWRMRRTWTALAASIVLVAVAVDVASYYWAVFVILALLAAASRVEEWLALGAMVASRAANALPIATENPDLRYTTQSVVFLAWATLATVLLVWRPRRRTSR
jgi:hypothetical protein